MPDANSTQTPEAENHSATPGVESAKSFPLLESMTAYAVMILLIVASILAMFNSKAVDNMFSLVGKLIGYVREELGLAWDTARAYWPNVRKHFRRYAAVLILTVTLAVILTVKGQDTAAAWCLIIGTVILYVTALVIQVTVGSLPLINNAKALGIAIGRPFAVIAVVMSFNAVALMAGPGILRNLPAATMLTALSLLLFSRSAVFGTKNDKMYHALVTVAVVMVGLTLVNHHILPAYPSAQNWVQARKAWAGYYFKHDTAVSDNSRWREFEVKTAGPLLAESGERTVDAVEAGQIVLADVESAKAIPGYPGECYDISVVVGSEVKAKGFYPLRELKPPTPPEPIVAEIAPPLPLASTPAVVPTTAPAPVLNRVSATVGSDWVDTGLRPTFKDEVVIGPIPERSGIEKTEAALCRVINGHLVPAIAPDDKRDPVVKLKARGDEGQFYALLQPTENLGGATLWLRHTGTEAVTLPVHINRNVILVSRAK